MLNKALWGKPSVLISQCVIHIMNINAIALGLGSHLHKCICNKLTAQAIPLHVYTVHLNKWKQILCKNYMQWVISTNVRSEKASFTLVYNLCISMFYFDLH